MDRKDRKTAFDNKGSEFKSFVEKLNEQVKEAKNSLTQMKKDLGTDIFRDISGDIKDINDTIDEGLEKYAKTFGKVSSGYKTLVTALKESNKQLTIGNEVSLNAQNRFQQIFDSILGFLDKIPGGGVLKEALGIDAIKTTLTDDLKSIFSKIDKNGKISLSQIQAAFTKTFSTIISTIGRALTLALTNPIFLTIAAVAILTKMFLSLQDAISGFRKETGIGRSQMQQLGLEVENIAFTSRQFGVTLDDAFNSANAIYKQFENISLITPKLVSTVALLNKNFAISEDTSSNVLMIFKAISGASDDIVSNMVGLTIEAARAGGVAPKDIFEDLASNSNFIYTYFKGSEQEIVKSAVGARRLGLALSDIEAITENLMDFNTSIENTMMASLMVGRQINFMKARQLIFEGKIDDANKEIFNQIKSIGDFDQLNIFQKKSIAQATGLTVGQLSKSLQIQKSISELHGEDKKRYDAAIKALSQQNNLTGKQILLEKEQQVATENIKNAFMGIGTSIGRLLLPILNVINPILNGIADAINFITGGVDDSTNSTAKWGKALLSVLAVLGLIVGSMLAFKGIALLIGKIPLFGGGGGGILTSIGRGFTGFAQSLVALVDPVVIGGLAIFVATMIGLGFALKLAAPGIKAFGEAFADIIVAGGKAISEIVSSVGDSLVKISGIGSGLLETAAGLWAISGALAAFTTVSVSNGLLNFLGLGSGSIIGQLSLLSGLAPGLNNTANALGNINNQLKGKAPSKIEDKLDKIIETLENLTFDVNLDGKKVGTGIAKVKYSSKLG